MGCPRCASWCLLSLPMINTIMPPCFQSQIPNCQTTSHHVRTSSFSLSLPPPLSVCLSVSSSDKKLACQWSHGPKTGSMCEQHGHVDVYSVDEEEDGCHHSTVHSLTNQSFYLLHQLAARIGWNTQRTSLLWGELSDWGATLNVVVVNHSKWVFKSVSRSCFPNKTSNTYENTSRFLLSYVSAAEDCPICQRRVQSRPDPTPLLSIFITTKPLRGR